MKEEEEAPRRSKSTALSALQEAVKSPSSKVLKTSEPSDDNDKPGGKESDGDDEISLITRRIKQMWKRKVQGIVHLKKNVQMLNQWTKSNEKPTNLL